jgi:thioredoxin 2
MITNTPTDAPTTERVLAVACQFCSTLNRVALDRVSQGPKCGSCGRPILLDRPLHVSDETFQQVLSGTDIPVLVDFYADWCGPCKMMAPFVDQLAAKVEGKALVAKLNTDFAPQISSGLGIRGIPTTIVFREGVESARLTGSVKLPELETLLGKATAAATA